MNLIINAIPLLTPLTGVGQYTYNISKILSSLNSNIDLFYFYNWTVSKNLMSPIHNGATKQNHHYRKTFHIDSLKNVVRRIPVLRDAAVSLKREIYGRRQYDLYFEPNFIPLNRIKSENVVATIHDFSVINNPEWHPRERVNYFNKEFYNNIYRAKKIIVVSDYIKEEALRLTDFTQDQIITIHNGYNNNLFYVYDNELILNRFKKKYNLPDDFLLFVGTVEPRKNLARLFEAYHQMSENVKRKFKFVVAGLSGWNNEDILKSIKGSENHIIYLGYIPDEDMPLLFNSATLFVYPSLYEGFGIPPIEAMACGCPVVVSNTSALPEVCGDSAHYVNPEDVDHMTITIESLLEDKKARSVLSQKGLDRVKEFSWEKSAKCHLNLFNELLA